jgi:hypothetical protein
MRGHSDGSHLAANNAVRLATKVPVGEPMWAATNGHLTVNKKEHGIHSAAVCMDFS